MQAPHIAKLDELRARLKADPKNRIFYPLAEELRKVGKSAEAEQVLRAGLEHHPTYLSAWVSLGRVLREVGKDQEAVDSLNRALQLDPGNVVAARLLGDAYLAVGEKVEAIKKYKLVHALLPGDEELLGTIARLDREIHAPTVAQLSEDDDMPFEMSGQEIVEDVAPPAAPEPVTSPDWADETAPPFELSTAPPDTGDDTPMLANHDESPFEEPLQSTYTAAAASIEAPAGMQIIDAPLSAEVALPWEEEVPEAAAEDDEDAYPPEPIPAEEPVINTLTMADLYTRQGLIDQARRVYQNILEREPENEDVRQRLAALDRTAGASDASSKQRKVDALQSWLDRVTRGEAPRV